MAASDNGYVLAPWLQAAMLLNTISIAGRHRQGECSGALILLVGFHRHLVGRCAGLHGSLASSSWLSLWPYACWPCASTLKPPCVEHPIHFHGVFILCTQNSIDKDNTKELQTVESPHCFHRLNLILECCPVKSPVCSKHINIVLGRGGRWRGGLFPIL